MIRPVPKKNYKRRKPTRKKRGEFDAKTRDDIVSRDEGLCRVCKRPAGQIHHVQPKGSGKGRGVFTNGMLVCQPCHTEIHADNGKLNFWKDVFSEMYGPDFYKDEHDYE